MTRTNATVHFDIGEAVARLLMRTLTVPQIFFEAAWPDAKRYVDVLAIDRAGSGDVHVVEVKSRFDLVATPAIRQLHRVPCHYRWFAAPIRGANDHLVHGLAKNLAKSGIGLIGIDVASNREAIVNIVSKPIRADSFDRTIIGDFLRKSVPDIAYGESPPASKKYTFRPLPKAKVQRYLDEADHLLKLGHERAAFLLAWSAIEAAMKLHLDLKGQMPMPSPGNLVRAMQEDEVMTASEMDSLNTALNLRNALVHGLDDPRNVRDAYRIVTAIARRLVN